MTDNPQALVEGSDAIPEPAFVDGDSPAIPDAAPSGLGHLLARLEKAEGPDRKLDVLVHCGVRGYTYISQRATLGYTYEHKGRKFYSRASEETPLTASLDAALALVERLCPADVRWIVKVAAAAWAQTEQPVAALPRHVLITFVKALIARDGGARAATKG